MTKEQLEWIKLNKDMIVSILQEYRMKTLEHLSSATPEEITGLQFLSEQIKGTINNLENIVKVKKKKGKTFTGI
jgi:hypothetical protein